MDKQELDPTMVTVVEDGDVTGDTQLGSKTGTVSDAEGMKRMGKQQVFERNFGFLTIFGFATILMGTWEAILGTAAFGLLNGGTSGLIYMFIAVAILFSLVIISMAEMASMAPTAGGQYHWVSEFAPRRYQKQLSYYVGWLCVLGWQGGVAISCYISAITLQGLIILNNPDYVPQRWHGSMINIAIVWFVAIFNTVLAKHLPLVEGLILFLHVAGFFAIIVPLWVLGPRSTSSEVWGSFLDGGNWGSIGLACLVGINTPISSMMGADAATHMSEELRNAGKSLPRAMVSTAVLNGCLGFIMVITFCYTLGDLENVLATPTGFPYIQVFYNATGSLGAATAMTSIVIIIGIAAGMTNMAAASRQLFAFARDKGVPCHGWFSHVAWDLPMNALFFTIAFSTVLPLINIGSSTAFNQIVDLSLVALLSSYLISIGCVTLRRIKNEPLLERHFNLGRWGLPINIASLAFLAVGFVLSFFPPAADPTPTTMNWVVVVYGGVIGIATVYYFTEGRRVYIGPVEYVRKSA